MSALSRLVRGPMRLAWFTYWSWRCSWRHLIDGSRTPFKGAPSVYVRCTVMAGRVYMRDAGAFGESAEQDSMIDYIRLARIEWASRTAERRKELAQ